MTFISSAGGRGFRGAFKGAAVMGAAALIGLGAPRGAWADDEPGFGGAAVGRKERAIGVGTALGGGFGSAGQGISGAFLLPTAELQFFMPAEYSIDVSVPVLNMALVSALTGGVLLGGDMFFNVNAGDGRVRFVGGPGIGFAFAEINNRSVAAVKIPAQIGFEALSKRRTFGFKLMARPWVEAGDGGFGGGLLGVVAFSGYVLSDTTSD
ncbi:MAG: hypothetical protein R3F14_36250 [Polyangiaceae bacterium]